MKLKMLRPDQLVRCYTGCPFCYRELGEPWMGCCGESGAYQTRIYEIEGEDEELYTEEELKSQFEIETSI